MTLFKLFLKLKLYKRIILHVMSSIVELFFVFMCNKLTALDFQHAFEYLGNVM